MEDLVGEFTAIENYHQSFNYPWNWKIYAEGQSECYHCDKLHGDTACMQQLDVRGLHMLVNDPNAGAFAFAVPSKVQNHTFNHLGEAVFPRIETLTDEEAATNLSIVIAPNIFMSLMSDSVLLLIWTPTGPTSMSAKRHRLYPRSTLQRVDFLEVQKIESQAIRYFVGQDDEAFRRVQEGLKSQFAPRGPISGREPILTGLNQWLVDRYRAADLPPPPKAEALRAVSG
jgi:hypothetical protein